MLLNPGCSRLRLMRRTGMVRGEVIDWAGRVNVNRMGLALASARPNLPWPVDNGLLVNVRIEGGSISLAFGDNDGGVDVG